MLRPAAAILLGLWERPWHMASDCCPYAAWPGPGLSLAHAPGAPVSARASRGLAEPWPPPCPFSEGSRTQTRLHLFDEFHHCVNPGSRCTHSITPIPEASTPWVHPVPGPPLAKPLLRALCTWNPMGRAMLSVVWLLTWPRGPESPSCGCPCRWSFLLVVEEPSGLRVDTVLISAHLLEDIGTPSSRIC